MSTPAPAPLRLGLAGLGTVGMGVVKIVQKHAALIASRAGRPVVITAVSARDRTKDRGADLSGYAWETDPVALAQRADVDVFIEVMGGHEGPARDSTEAAIAAGKDVVVMGVMNGSCNYILTRMQSENLPYEAVFEEARQLGYLEADPNLDVGGIDAGHKLALLASIAFGTKVSFDAVELEGIGNVSIDDIQLAEDMGYRIKLLGVAQMTDRGLEQRMTPCLVPKGSPLGQLQGGTNMVVLEGDSVGQIVMRGPGAGMGPTASAVMSDVIDLARGTRISTFGQPAATLSDSLPAKTVTPAAHYLRMTLLDKPGTMAKIATCLGEAGVSIDQMRQYGHTSDGTDSLSPRHSPAGARVLIVTHKATRTEVDAAVAKFAATGVIVGAPVVLRIEEV